MHLVLQLMDLRLQVHQNLRLLMRRSAVCKMAQSVIVHRKALVAFVVVVVHHGFVHELVVSEGMHTGTHMMNQLGDLVLEADERGDHGLDATLDVLHVGVVLGGDMAGAAFAVLVGRAEIWRLDVVSYDEQDKVVEIEIIFTHLDGGLGQQT